MAGKWFYSGYNAIASSTIDWTDKLAITLMDVGYVLDQTAVYMSEIITDELSTSGTGYTRHQLTGVTPSLVTLSNPTRKIYSYTISESSTSWSVPEGGALSTVGAAIYHDTSVSGIGNDDAGSELLLYMDFNGTQPFAAFDVCRFVPDARGIAWINL